MKEVSGLIPSLLERLTDEKPRSRKDPSNNKTVDINKYRDSVLKDILYLLNSINFESNGFEDALPDYVKSSTLNYGIQALSGVNISDIDWLGVETSILDALINFEPRLLPDDLKVVVHIENELYTNHNKLLIEIKGLLKLNPYPREFWLRTTIDVETGLFSLVDGSINE